MYELGKSDEYDMDLYNRYQHGEFYSADSIRMIDSLVYTTVGGRTVYGGGGIMPDVFIPQDTSHITSYYVNVMNMGIVHQFTLEYSERNLEKLASYKANYKDLYAYLKQQPLLSEFIDYAEDKGVKRRPTLIQISRNLIENALYASIVENFFNDGFYPIIYQDDITMHRAIQVIKDGTWLPVGTV
jgi:carboxyl-terminal processing protease